MAIFINFVMRSPPKKGKGVKPLKKGFGLTLAMKGYIYIILPLILIGLHKTKILRYYTAIFINFIMRCPPKKGKGVKPLKKGFFAYLGRDRVHFHFLTIHLNFA